MLRVALGVGGGAAGTDGTPELELSGPAGFFSLDIGGSLTRRLALHARLGGYSMVEPSVSIGGDEVGELDNASLSFGMLGVGLTYYFPSNLYLTGAIGASSATLEVNGDEYESDTGFGLMGDIGYEWSILTLAVETGRARDRRELLFADDNHAGCPVPRVPSTSFVSGLSELYALLAALL